jgi:hypothetical protein
VTTITDRWWRITGYRKTSEGGVPSTLRALTASEHSSSSAAAPR